MKQRAIMEKFYLEDGTAVPFTPGQTVLEALLDNQHKIDSICGGMGSCGTCHVFVLSGEELLPERNEIENMRAQDLNFVSSERQACQLIAIPNIKIRIP